MPRPPSVKESAVEAAISRLCNSGLPPLELFEQVAARLRGVVPYTAGCWKPLDPETLLFTGFAIEDPEPGTLRAVRWRFIDNELLEPDHGKFRILARRRQPVTTLEAATHGEPERSLRYRQLHKKLGFGAELRAVFRTGRACWGSVALVRATGEPDFSRREVAFVGRLCDHIALGLRQSMLREVTLPDEGNELPGMMVLREDLSVESTTSRAEKWLDEFPGDAGVGLELPVAVYAVARGVWGAQGGPGGTSRASRVRLTDGRWIALHAAPLHQHDADDRRVAVMFSAATPADMTPLRLELYGLSDREGDVTRQLVCGLSVDDIATALYISRHTVKDHIKAIYAKVGVTNRAELTATLFHEQYAPTFDASRLREFTPSVAHAPHRMWDPSN
jgi:DNA-binding CsgD family transcriptional regulator